MLCAIVCPNDAFHENITPGEQINLKEFPSIGKFFKINMKKCIEDPNNETCQLCLTVRDRNNIEDFFKIQKECPTQCFSIDSPIKGDVIIKRNMLHKCDPQGCKACVNICPTESFFIPESAEDVKKFGKIACNEDECFYCGACENSCPDELIIVDRKDIIIEDPKKIGNYPWIQGWIKNIKEILRKALIQGKQQLQIPIIEEEVRKVKEKIEETVPQLSKEDKIKLNELNEKIQTFIRSSKIRYWIKDKKTEKTKTPVLDNFGRDLTRLATEDKLDPVVGREKEIERVAQILSRRKKNNPVLIGEPGVGKTAIAEGLALRIVQKKVPRILQEKRVVTLDLA
ncbi:MAG: 4Fe-4S dicluster domain-containing protein, partial [Candidatus Lokiarchaeia archaeon]|nr:4Fe-4S dicluster domain-containing protein [Candidatus Lokiarchaeia archaeon]